MIFNLNFLYFDPVSLLIYQVSLLKVRPRLKVIVVKQHSDTNRFLRPYRPVVLSCNRQTNLHTNPAVKHKNFQCENLERTYVKSSKCKTGHKLLGMMMWRVHTVLSTQLYNAQCIFPAHLKQ